MLTPVVAAGAALRAHDGARALVLAPNDVSDELAESATTVGPDGATTHVVLGDLRGALSYGLLDAAFGALMRGAHLWALQRGRYFLAGGEPHVDTGAVVAGLEYAAGVTAHVLGKPSASFARLALSGVAGIAADRTWVVGDDATSTSRWVSRRDCAPCSCAPGRARGRPTPLGSSPPRQSWTRSPTSRDCCNRSEALCRRPALARWGGRRTSDVGAASLR